MLNFYKTQDNRVEEIPSLEEGCWVSAVAPTEEEVRFLTGEMGLDADFVRSSLDEEESSRIESEGDQTLVIVDIPISERQDEKTILYSTTPIGIIMTSEYVITISTRSQAILSELSGGVVKNVATHLHTRFLLSLLLRIASRYLTYLKQIDKIS